MPRSTSFRARKEMQKEKGPEFLGTFFLWFSIGVEPQLATLSEFLVMMRSTTFSTS